MHAIQSMEKNKPIQQSHQVKKRITGNSCQNAHGHSQKSFGPFRDGSFIGMKCNDMIQVSLEATSQPAYPGGSLFFPLKHDKNQGAGDALTPHQGDH